MLNHTTSPDKVELVTLGGKAQNDEQVQITCSNSIFQTP